MLLSIDTSKLLLLHLIQEVLEVAAAAESATVLLLLLLLVRLLPAAVWDDASSAVVPVKVLPLLSLSGAVEEGAAGSVLSELLV